MGRRSREILQIVSLAVQVIFWIFAGTSIVIVGKDNLENVEKIEVEMEELDKESFAFNLSPNFSKPSQEEEYKLMEYYGDKRSNLTSELDSGINTLVVFCGGNSLYTVLSMVMVIASLISQIKKKSQTP